MPPPFGINLTDSTVILTPGGLPLPSPLDWIKRSLNVATLETFGCYYQQVKADRKISIFLKLAWGALWWDSPLTVPSTVKDKPGYCAYAGLKLEEVHRFNLLDCRCWTPLTRPSRKWWNDLLWQTLMIMSLLGNLRCTSLLLSVSPSPVQNLLQRQLIGENV